MGNWKSIKEEIYNIVGTMTIANGYNYDWETVRRYDAYTMETTNCVFSLHYPEEEAFVEDATDEMPPPTMTRSLVRSVEFKCKPISDALDVDTEDVIDENNDALDKAFEDITKAFYSDTLGSCNLGVKKVEFTEAVKEPISSKGAYYPFLLSANFRIYYHEPRGQ